MNFEMFHWFYLLLIGALCLLCMVFIVLLPFKNQEKISFREFMTLWLSAFSLCATFLLSVLIFVAPIDMPFLKMAHLLSLVGVILFFDGYVQTQSLESQIKRFSINLLIPLSVLCLLFFIVNRAARLLPDDTLFQPLLWVVFHLSFGVSLLKERPLKRNLIPLILAGLSLITYLVNAFIFRSLFLEHSLFPALVLGVLTQKALSGFYRLMTPDTTDAPYESAESLDNATYLDITKNLQTNITDIVEKGLKIKSQLGEVESLIEENNHLASDYSDYTQKDIEILKKRGEITQYLIEQIDKEKFHTTEAEKELYVIMDKVHDIFENSKEIEKNIENLTSGMTLGHNIVEDNLHSMNMMKKSIEEVSHILFVINDISDKTNMLAINAAIEASHAGIYGKGFGVVAEEIRNVSLLTTGEADSIAQRIKAITEKSVNREEAILSIETIFGSFSSNIERFFIYILNVIQSIKDLKNNIDILWKYLASLNHIITEDYDRIYNELKYNRQIREKYTSVHLFCRQIETNIAKVDKDFRVIMETMNQLQSSLEFGISQSQKLENEFQ